MGVIVGPYNTMWLVLLLAGCATSIEGLGQFENRLACTLARDRAYVVSEYGPLGISSRIADIDREVVCR